MNIPQLRFPKLKGKWNEKKMGEIYSFKVTNSFSRDNLNYAEGTVKNIHYGDIHTKFQTLFDITKEKVPFINADISVNRISEDNYCKEGDLILADASEDLNDVGKSIEIINLNNEKLLAGLHTILSRPNFEKFHIGFGGYLFKSNKVRTKIQKEAQGSKVLSISATRLTNISLDFPSKDEQRKIVDFFIAIDEKIQAFKMKHSLLEQYKKGVIQKLFSQELRFKAANGNEFPNWEVKKLGAVCEIYDGTHQTPTYVQDGVPFYSVEQLTANDFKKTKFVTQEVFEKENKRVKLEKGDVLMTRIGDIGTSRYIDWDVNASFYVSIALIKQSSKCNSKYIHHFIGTKYFQNELWNRTIHVAFPKKINLGEIGNCLINLPCLTEQALIANLLSALDEKISQTQKQIEKTEIWKNGLMQKMFC